MGTVHDPSVGTSKAGSASHVKHVRSRPSLHHCAWWRSPAPCCEAPFTGPFSGDHQTCPYTCVVLCLDNYNKFLNRELCDHQGVKNDVGVGRCAADGNHTELINRAFLPTSTNQERGAQNLEFVLQQVHTSLMALTSYEANDIVANSRKNPLEAW